MAKDLQMKGMQDKQMKFKDTDNNDDLNSSFFKGFS